MEFKLSRFTRSVTCAPRPRLGLPQSVRRVLRTRVNPTVRASVHETHETSRGSASSEAEVLQLRRTVEHLKSLNEELSQEISQVVRSLSSALDALPKQLEDAATGAGSDGAGSSSGASGSSPTPAAGSSSSSGQAEPCSPMYHQPPDVAQARLSCSVPHPGTLCCTKTSVTEVDGAFVVNMSTTARTTRGRLSARDLAAVGSRALECAAVDFSRARSSAAQAEVLPADRAARHAALCETLAEGRVLAAERNPVTSEFGHESYVLLLEHPRTGARLRGLVKPRVPGDSNGWHRAPIEVVAYRLNLLLGFDYVPPAVYRSGGLHLRVGDERLEYEEGAVCLWVEGAAQMEELPPNADAFLSDTRILDVLIHNSDRHRGHFLSGPHWATGPMPSAHAGGANGSAAAVATAAGRAEARLSPVLIDHAAGFRKEAFVKMEHENAFCTGPVCRVRAGTYLRLRLLDRHTCQQQFGGLLSEQEIREMLHRRNYVLRYLDDLVAKQGFEATVIE